jgi:ribosomal protein S18 acetylase RimI-like enzyme
VSGGGAVSGDVADRILAAAARAVRRRCEGVHGAEVLERDGLILSLTNLPDPSLNAAFVEREPGDARSALSWAEEELNRRGHPFGLDHPVGRWPGLDRAIGEAGFERLAVRPLMIAGVESLPFPGPPRGVEIRPVADRAEAVALARVDAEAWDGDPAISERAFVPSALGLQGSIGLVAWAGSEPVGCAIAQSHEGTVAIFGVGVASSARRRGIGTALTLTAARAFPGDLAWLLPSEMARSMYERLGFRAFEDWEIRVRRAA